LYTKWGSLQKTLCFLAFTISYVIYYQYQEYADFRHMKHNNSKLNSNEIVSCFIEKEQGYFDIEDVYKTHPNASKGAIRELLSDMSRRGILSRIKEGLYLIIPLGDDSNTYTPNWHLLAKHLVKNADFYIGYYSALQIHELITQPSLKQQIVVSKQQKKSILHLKNLKVQFIYHNQAHFFGSKKIWINKYDKVLCSDLEKTFIDCLFKPDYAGGIVEIARAIYISRGKMDFGRLLNYAIKFKSQAVYKRLGYLLEVLNIKSDIIESLFTLRSNSYVVLDTELPKQGKRSSRWKVQKNIDEETIKSALET